MKPGDLIAAAIKPVGHNLLHLGCYDDLGNLRPESRCNKRRIEINQFSDKVYDFFFGSTEQAEETQDGSNK